MRNPRKILLLLPCLLVAACADVAGYDPGESVETLAAEPASSSPAVSQEPAAGSQVQDDPRAQFSAVEARRQKRRLLARNYVALGDDRFQRNDFRGAMQQYSEAFQLDPESKDARDGLRRTQAALGGDGWSWLDQEGVVEQQALRWSATRLKVEGLIQDGDMAMIGGEFAAAADHYLTAQQALRFSPNIANDSLNQALVQGKLEQAREAGVQSAEATRRADAELSRREAEAEEEARRTYQENRIRTLFGEANNQFENGFYQKSITTLDKVLGADPRNGDAKELRAIANEAWHQQTERRNADRFREEWKKTFQDLRSLAVPPLSSVEFDKAHWAKISINRRPIDEIDDELAADPEAEAIRRMLENTPVTPRFDNPIEEVAENLAALTHVNFVVSRAVREDVDDDVKQVNFAFTKPMPVSQILDIIEAQSGGALKFRIQHGAVNVISSEEANTGHVLRRYEVRSIIRPLPDFDGQEIQLSPSGGIDFEPEPLNEDKEANLLTEDTLLTILGVDDWEEPASASIQEGTLIVYHQPEKQQEIRDLLADLRKSTNTSVEIKVRFLKVEDSFLQDVGIDFRGLGNQSTEGIPGIGSNVGFDDFGEDPTGILGTDGDAGFFFREADDDVNIYGRTENLYDLGLGAGRQRSRFLDGNSSGLADDTGADGLTNSGGLSMQWALLDDAEVQMILRAVEKSKRSEVVTEPRLMVYNATRATLTVANQVSYVADFDVEIAQAASIAAPIVRVIMDGVFLDVTPVVSSDRRSVSIDLRPTVATLKRPIRTFQTSLGSGSPVTIMLPELELQKVRTRATVPDGGTLLVGGFKVIEQQDMTSGIPFLNRIPILSFFFQRQGNYESYQRLVVLLTAHIIIPDERAPDVTSAGVVH